MVEVHVHSFDFSAITCQNNSQQQQQHRNKQCNWIHCLIWFVQKFSLILKFHLFLRLWSLCCPRTSQPKLLLCLVPACLTSHNHLELIISAILGERYTVWNSLLHYQLTTHLNHSSWVTLFFLAFCFSVVPIYSLTS